MIKRKQPKIESMLWKMLKNSSKVLMKKKKEFANKKEILQHRCLHPGIPMFHLILFLEGEKQEQKCYNKVKYSYVHAEMTPLCVENNNKNREDTQMDIPSVILQLRA